MEDFGQVKEAWRKTFLELPSSIPSHDTFNRIFQAIATHSFLECSVRWTQSLRVAVSEEIVALDGKAVRRDLHAGRTAPMLVSAWARENGLVLGQLKVNAKSNEITAVHELSRALDAMGCQKHFAQEIKEADAEYLLPLKGNQGTVHQEVQSYLEDAIARGVKELIQVETVEMDRGWLETRR